MATVKGFKKSFCCGGGEVHVKFITLMTLKNNFIYLRVLAMLGLPCLTGLSLVALSRGYSSCGVQASDCGGRSLQSAGSRAHGRE